MSAARSVAAVARTVARPGVAAGALAGPRPSWRPSADAGHRLRGATPRPAVVDRAPDPDRWRHGLAEGDRSGPCATKARCCWRSATWASAESSCRWPSSRQRGWILFDDAGPTLRATRPDGHGDHDLAAWERILPEYAAAAALGRGAGRDRADARGRDSGRAAGSAASGAGTAARRRLASGTRPGRRARRRRPSPRGAWRRDCPRSVSWRRASRRPASTPRSSTTTSTAATSWSARAATDSSTGVTPSSPTHSRR